ncbi:hypothetical protein FKM82_020244 [Ascaphus truei]
MLHTTTLINSGQKFQYLNTFLSKLHDCLLFIALLCIETPEHPYILAQYMGFNLYIYIYIYIYIHIHIHIHIGCVGM